MYVHVTPVHVHKQVSLLYHRIGACKVLCSKRNKYLLLLSSSGRNLLPGLLQPVEGRALQASENGVQGVEVLYLVTLLCNLSGKHNSSYIGIIIQVYMYMYMYVYVYVYAYVYVCTCTVVYVHVHFCI